MLEIAAVSTTAAAAIGFICRCGLLGFRVGARVVLVGASSAALPGFLGDCLC